MLNYFNEVSNSFVTMIDDDSYNAAIGLASNGPEKVLKIEILERD